MSTTPKYNWPLIENTDFVTNLPADLEALADDIDSTVYSLDQDNVKITEFVAKGDLLSASAENTPARLGVGANGTILTADSAEATGLKWEPLAGSASNWTLVNTGGTALTGAGTITVSGITDANKLMVVVRDGSISTTSQNIVMRFNGDTGSNYNFDSIYVRGGSSYAADIVNALGQTTTSITLCLVGSDAGHAANGFLLLDGGNSSGLKVFNYAMGVFPASGNGHRNYTGGGTYSGTSTISSVSLIAGSGNFDAGTMFVYKSA
jgi:hypothetical protein